MNTRKYSQVKNILINNLYLILELNFRFFFYHKKKIIEKNIVEIIFLIQ